MTSGFPCVTAPWPMLLPTAGFSTRGVCRSQSAAKNIAGVGHGTLVSAGFYSFGCVLGIPII